MHISKTASLFLLAAVVVGSWKGYLALFDQGAKEPKRIFPYCVSALPEADQQALQRGILVRNDRDLAQLLEDYLS